MKLSSGDDEGRELPAGQESLAFGVSPPRPGSKVPAPGAISARAIRGGYTVGPRENRTILFGRNKDEVHVCVGEDDRQISRRHGMFTHRQGAWWVSNTGKRPIRLPQTHWLFPAEEEIPLASGYTPLFIPGSGGREHLLEVYVVGPDGDQPTTIHTELTESPKIWRIVPQERLVLVALGQRYLRHEARPQPWGRQQVADLLTDLQPGAEWDHRKVERVIAAVRMRLAKAGVPGLTRKEVPEPVGNGLNHNLLTELVINTTTLVPPDLTILDDPPAPDSDDTEA